MVLLVWNQEGEDYPEGLRNFKKRWKVVILRSVLFVPDLKEFRCQMIQQCVVKR